MSPLTQLSRILVPVFSLALLAGYVAYSHRTAQTSVEQKVPPRMLPPLPIKRVDSFAMQTAFIETANQQMTLYPAHDEAPVKTSVLKKLPLFDPRRWLHIIPSIDAAIFQDRHGMLMGSSKSGIVQIGFPLTPPEIPDTETVLDKKDEPAVVLSKPVVNALEPELPKPSASGPRLWIRRPLDQRGSETLQILPSSGTEAKKSFPLEIDWAVALEPFEEDTVYLSITGFTSFIPYTIEPRGWAMKYQRYLDEVFRAVTEQVPSQLPEHLVLFPNPPSRIEHCFFQRPFREVVDDVFDGTTFHMPFKPWSRYFPRGPKTLVERG